MPEWLAVIILGIVEGITEFLPVSSTGHLLLFQHWLPEQSDAFNVGIQSAAVVAVIAVFHQRLRDMVTRWRDKEVRDYTLKLGLALGITLAGGVVLKLLHFKLPKTVAPVAIATLVGGVLFLVVERWLKGKSPKLEITWAMAVAMGLAQLVAAVFPGTSRSGITILIALVMGLGRTPATEFAFLLGVPTLVAAGAVEMLGALRHPPAQPEHWGMIALGSVVAAITAFGAVKWLLKFVQTHTFVAFGWYRIVLGALILLFASTGAK